MHAFPISSSSRNGRLVTIKYTFMIIKPKSKLQMYNEEKFVSHATPWSTTQSIGSRLSRTYFVVKDLCVRTRCLLVYNTKRKKVASTWKSRQSITKGRPKGKRNRYKRVLCFFLIFTERARVSSFVHILIYVSSLLQFFFHLRTPHRLWVLQSMYTT